MDAALLEAQQPTASEFFGGIREGVSLHNAALSLMNKRVDDHVPFRAEYLNRIRQLLNTRKQRTAQETTKQPIAPP